MSCIFCDSKDVRFVEFQTEFYSHELKQHGDEICQFCGTHQYYSADLLGMMGYDLDEYKDMDRPTWARNVYSVVKWNEFLRAVEEGDFSIGDTIWINGTEFTVSRKE